MRRPRCAPSHSCAPSRPGPGPGASPRPGADKGSPRTVDCPSGGSAPRESCPRDRTVAGAPSPRGRRRAIWRRLLQTETAFARELHHRLRIEAQGPDNPVTLARDDRAGPVGSREHPQQRSVSLAIPRPRHPVVFRPAVDRLSRQRTSVQAPPQEETLRHRFDRDSVGHRHSGTPPFGRVHPQSQLRQAESRRRATEPGTGHRRGGLGGRAAVASPRGSGR